MICVFQISVTFSGTASRGQCSRLISMIVTISGAFGQGKAHPINHMIGNARICALSATQVASNKADCSDNQLLIRSFNTFVSETF